MKKKNILFITLMLLVSCGYENTTSITNNDSSNNDSLTSNNNSHISIGIIIPNNSETSKNEASNSNFISSETVSSNNSFSSNSNSINSTSNEIIDDYYSSIDFSKTGEALKNELYNLIKQCDMSKYSYDTCDSYIANANEDPNNSNNLIDFYTGRSIPKNYYPTSAEKPDAWNKEHVYAKSHGNFKSQDAGKDIHHLMPTDNGVNAKRSAKDFDDCTSEDNAIKTYKSYKQTVTVNYIDENDMCYTNSNAFEPRDAVKGDVARILFYMVTRYNGQNDGGPNLQLVDNYTSGSAPTLGKLSTLKKWHEEDPVDEFEMKRNNYIYSIQNNRNPYIDHPELVNLIF